MIGRIQPKRMVAEQKIARNELGFLITLTRSKFLRGFPALEAQSGHG